MYSQGSLPTKDELYGWFTGRCYHYKLQNTASGEILIGAYDEADGGPLFPNPFKIMFLFKYGGEADVFDELTPEEISSVSESIGKEISGKSEAKEVDGALESEVYGKDTRYRVKKFNNYYIGKMLDDKGSTHLNCYFFKKVYSY